MTRLTLLQEWQNNATPISLFGGADCSVRQWITTLEFVVAEASVVDQIYFTMSINTNLPQSAVGLYVMQIIHPSSHQLVKQYIHRVSVQSGWMTVQHNCNISQQLSRYNHNLTSLYFDEKNYVTNQFVMLFYEISSNLLLKDHVW